ncbi:Hypothetical protein PHPALM_3011 [Phytophthora palmivora]|uniref:Myb/SANT-like domain-containing protein n=1 Tax=Phytophthora palmivora TaxID=4796 RepID=A0A2P4YNJ0_9STRA|nr:Hypothetical protein PHPALM_3011 [Phytophthora palmivora]
MVLFQETEVLRLLDLYTELHADSSNVTTKSGVLLKQRAREMLTTSLNKSFPREQPWTENQVTVKFKNLRSDYSEYRWLSSQPGFQADGEGLDEDWWQGIKRLRPKGHAFKGKLPWVFESRMREIVGDVGQDNSLQRPVKKQRTQQIEEGRQEEGGDDTAMVQLVQTDDVQSPPHDDVGNEEGLGSRQEQEHSGLAVKDDANDFSYSRSLARSVEQSSVAAAGMARGFQDLIAMFQEHTASCRALEQQLTQRGAETPSLVLAEQRSVLLAIARSLEQSTRATADMAQGYRDLVKAFVHESDTRQQREG